MQLGKTLILGDSYSTFAGYIPDGFHSWYPRAADNDVQRVEDTWWYRLFDGHDNILVRNDSFSGATVCNTVRPELSVDTSFVSRLQALIAGGFFIKNPVDTVLVFGGTNDYWTNAPVGQFQTAPFTEQDLLAFAPACCAIAAQLAESAPTAKVCWLINTELGTDYSAGIRQAAAHYGQTCLAFPHIDKQAGHPSVQGMAEIAAAIRAF
mgnify:FL=1